MEWWSGGWMTGGCHLDKNTAAVHAWGHVQPHASSSAACFVVSRPCGRVSGTAEPDHAAGRCAHDLLLVPAATPGGPARHAEG